LTCFLDDRRLKRLSELDIGQATQERTARHRQIAEPVILAEEESAEEMEVEDKIQEEKEESEEEEDEIDEEERAARRLELKKKALQRQEV
jgi:hypothetical protein